jgi:dephospho-CoA kinase
MRIGLTGGIASGKTTVAARFTELGITVIDADDSARAVVARGTPGLTAVIAAFGAGVLDPHGELDRPAVRDLIFADPERRKQLEAILHPLIRAHMDRLATLALGPYLVMAIPLLVEGASRRGLDRILVVDVAEEMQLSRVMARDGSTPAQARAIIAAQASRQARLSAADDVLVNSGTVPELRQAVDVLHHKYLDLAGTSHTPLT